MTSSAPTRRTPPLWLQVCLRPRAAFARAAGEGSITSLLLLGAAAGILQSLVSMAAHQVGTRWPPGAVLPVMVAVGAAWGVLQLSVVARIVALVWNRSGRGVPFRPLHRLLALAMAPQVLALGCWTIGILVVGPSLYLDPEFAIIATPASGVLSGLVAVTTLVAWIWSAVLVGTAIAFLHPTRGLLAGLGSVALFAATAMGFFRLSPFLFQ